MIHAAAHGQLLHPPPHRHVHPLHLNHPLRTRPERRPGLVPRLPRDARQHPRPHRRETRRNPLPPHVDRRQPVSRRLRPSQPRLPTHIPSLRLTCPATTTRSRRSHTQFAWILNHGNRPGRRRQRCSPAGAEHERASDWRCQLDRRPELVRPRERSVAQRPRGRTPASATLEFELAEAELGWLARQYRSGSELEHERGQAIDLGGG
jgi:hypothetical protein